MLIAQTPFKRQDMPLMRGVIWVSRPPVSPPLGASGQPPFIASSLDEGAEVLVALWTDASVTALHGHVDMGTGLRTALTQMVAEELSLDLSRVHMVMGHTSVSPNQGATIASNSIQTHAKPLQCAAAQILQWGLDQSAHYFGVSVSDVLYGEEGFHVMATDNEALDLFYQTARKRVLPWSELLFDQNIALQLDLNAPLKDRQAYRLVGQAVPRVDIPLKAQAQLTFVHDMRIEGMLHGRVVRPPYAGVDSGDFVGKTLLKVECESVSHVPGLRAVVVQGDFVGVVCEREEHAEQAMKELVVHWKSWPGVGSLQDTENALSKQAFTERELINDGDVQSALQGAAVSLSQTYVWPYQMHASIGPSCALAQWCSDEEFQATGTRMRVWAGTQNPHVLRADLALIAGTVDASVEVIRMEAAGCYGRNCADDVAADAALLSKALKAPVRVQLTREQEHAWEPKGAAQVMKVRGALDKEGHALAYDFLSAYPSNGAPTLALLLTRLIEPVAKVYEMGDRTARPPYEFAHLRVRVQDMAPILRASWLRGVSALPNSFAHESFMDELAFEAQVDPVQFRLQSMSDSRAGELLKATADKANWIKHTRPQQQASDVRDARDARDASQPSEGAWLKGQGVAYARYVHSKWPGFGAAYSAWVADVQVNPNTGEVHVSKVVVGHDAGMLINPQGVEHQVNGNVIQTTSRALKEDVQTDPQTGSVQSLEWGSYPILNFRQVPVIEVLHMPRQDQDPLGAGESSSVPGTAAIANAIFDATGVRFRNPPFTPDKILAALNPLGQESKPEGTFKDPSKVGLGTRVWGSKAQAFFAKHPLRALTLKGVAKGVMGFGFQSLGVLSAAFLCALGWVLYGPNLNANLQLTAPVNLSMYGPKMIERGAQLALMGNCQGCHTQEAGMLNAGGRPIPTPFGVIYSSNITPDAQTGIGGWSYKAFERAMREGISAKGHQLYPAFPFTSFKSINDEDLMSLYAWTMSQTPVASEPKKNTLAFPFNLRGLMKVWNALFLEQVPPQPANTSSALLLRGAYLVNSVGHCSACHTERNLLGAEKRGTQDLQGAYVNGWYAPALSVNNAAPMPWTQEDLYRYLRTGHTEYHGVASGPMGEIVQSWAGVPDEDLLAMSVYLGAKMNPAGLSDASLQSKAKERVDASKLKEEVNTGLSVGQRQFEGSCWSCHHEGGGPNLLGTNASLSLNTNVHSATPNNLIQIILKGCPSPAGKDLGFMPAFKDSLNAAQIKDLVHYIRGRFAPEQPPWSKVSQEIDQVLRAEKLR